jgi:hypothetical protein
LFTAFGLVLRAFGPVLRAFEPVYFVFGACARRRDVIRLQLTDVRPVFLKWLLEKKYSCVKQSHRSMIAELDNPSREHLEELFKALNMAARIIYLNDVNMCAYSETVWSSMGMFMECERETTNAKLQDFLCARSMSPKRGREERCSLYMDLMSDDVRCKCETCSNLQKIGRF